MMRVVAGCDGGGTKCTVRVAMVLDGQTIREGQASSGPANIKSDPSQALQSIGAALHQALLATDLAEDYPIDTFVAALAGAGTAEQQQKWRLQLTQEFNLRKVAVIPDILALFAAVDRPEDRPAIATVIGTGSIAWGKHTNGRMVRAGGLGPDVGDEGSGYWIGKEALARCRAAENSKLHQLFASHGVAYESHPSPGEIARLSRIVFKASQTDATAKNILTAAAHHIAKLISQVASDWNQTVAHELDPYGTYDWICAGGVAVNQTTWLESIREICRADGVELSQPFLVSEPVAGALKLALTGVT